MTPDDMRWVPSSVPEGATLMPSEQDARMLAKVSVGSKPKESPKHRLSGSTSLWFSLWTSDTTRAVVYVEGAKAWLYKE